MITIKNELEIEKMRKSGKILAEILVKLQKAVKPGFSTGRLEILARDLMRENNCRPAFMGFADRGHKRVYPTALCVSLNSELVHTPAFPSRVFKEGDLVSIDCGVEYEKFFSDAAVSFFIGKPPAQVKKLLRVTKKSLEQGISKVKNGVSLGDVSSAIQKYVEKNGFTVIRSLVGHGIGRMLHEDPPVPNFGKEGEGIKLKKGMTIAIEPMVSMGGCEIETLSDGWAIATKDRSLCAHFEHTVVVGERKAEILTKL
jgi:methionyl aminopeptidase